MLVFCGYAFILLIDKVLIDAHGGSGHNHNKGHNAKHHNEGDDDGDKGEGDGSVVDTEQIN